MGQAPRIDPYRRLGFVIGSEPVPFFTALERHSHGAGVVGACGCEYDDDLYSRAAAGAAGGAESAGSVVGLWEIETCGRGGVARSERAGFSVFSFQFSVNRRFEI